jgi:hypothetical protein
VARFGAEGDCEKMLKSGEKEVVSGKMGIKKDL